MPKNYLMIYSEQLAADIELLSKEIGEIQNAITQGIPTYELKYSAKVGRKWLRIVTLDE